MKISIISVLLLSASVSFAWQLDSASDLKKVSVVDAKGQRPAILKEQLKVGMMVQTGPNAKALLVEGDSKFWMGENTKVELKAGSPTQIIEIKEGKSRFEIKKNEANKYQYKTPSAAAAIRGTEFYMSNVNLSERVAVFEGIVEVTFNKTNYKLPAGTGVLISEQKEIKTEKLEVKDVADWKKATFFTLDKPEGGQGVD